jgi:hypothetical protein
MRKWSKRSTARVAWCGVLIVLGSGAAGVWAAGGTKLVFNGKVASTAVRTIDGKAYVPISDVAKALGLSVVPIADGYEIKKAGGATPIAGLQGKVGDVLFDGKWRFQVLSVDTVDSYKMKNKSTVDYALYNQVADLDNDTNTFTPKAGRSLIAVKCRVTNGRNATYSLWVNNNDTRTALADTNGESHPPFVYDMDESEPFSTKKLLPGAKTDFTVLFSVPEGITLKDLVFTLRTINNNDKGNDARVSLQ